jgi:cytochrome c-type biogenesis protein CcmE
MAEATWEKSDYLEKKKNGAGSKNIKFILGGMLMLGAVLYLVLSGTATGARYFITVDEVVNNPDYVGKTVRISGAVLGDTIAYDSQNLELNFTIVNIPEEYEDLATTLNQAVNNPDATRLPIYMENEVMPDLLQHEAQAILTGEIGPDGVFYASELLLKCPSRYQEAEPGQSLAEPAGA